MKKFFLNMLLISILAIGGAAMAKDLEQPFNKGEINPYSEFFTGRQNCEKTGRGHFELGVE